MKIKVERFQEKKEEKKKKREKMSRRRIRRRENNKEGSCLTSILVPFSNSFFSPSSRNAH